MKRIDRSCSVTARAAVIALAFPLLLSSVGSAANRKWNNPGGGAFGNGGNWIPLGVPAAGEDIFIDLPGNYTVQTGGSNFSFGTLHVGAAGSVQLTVQSGDRLTASTITDINGGGRINVQGTLSAGALNILSGTLTTSNGLVDLAGGLLQQGGSTILNGGQIRVGTTMRFNSGTVSGGGTLAGNIISSANFKPGSNATLLINGSYIQNPVASSLFQVINPGSGAVASRLNVNGPATLTGALQLTASFIPPAGTVVQTMSFNSHLGAFQTVTVPPANGGVLLQPVFTPTKLMILAIPIPIISITPSSRSVSPRASDSFTVSIPTALASDTTVALSSSSPSSATLPASVVIRRGETSAVFAVTGVATGSTTIGATLPAAVGGSTATATLTIGNRPAAVVVTSIPAPMIVAPGDGSTASSFYVLQNSGDTATNVSLAAIGDLTAGAFFSQSPTSFTLNPGDSQTVQITAFAENAAAALTGFSVVSGTGTPPNLRIPVRLLVGPPSSGNPSVIALDKRIDVSASGNPTGTVRYQNVGSGAATGLAAGDVPWITPQAGLITIAPGAIVSVSFTIDRSQRPDVTLLTGSAKCTLSFFYPAPASGGKGALPLASPPGLAAPVAISDTVKPVSASSGLTPLAAGEVALVIPGVGHVVGSGGKEFVSDVSILNEVSGAVNDVQLYFTSATASVAAAQSLAPSQSLLLADAVTTFFGNQGEVGTLHLRSSQVDKLDVAANVFNRANPKGTYGTALPVFRSNRGIAPGDSLWISGIRKDATAHTNLYIQEVSGTAAAVDVSFKNSAGGVVSTLINQQVGAFGLLQMNSAAPDGAVFATINNRSGGQIVAFATPVDDASGDTWAVADWSRQFGIGPADPQVIVVAGAAPGANNTYFRTDLAITNAGAAFATGTLTYLPTNVVRNISLAPGQSLILSDVVTNFFNAPPSVGSMIFRPDQPANVVITSRTYTTVQGDVATFGTGVPTLPMSAALRAGESRLFGGLEDSPLTTIQSARAATFRTNFGLVETTRNPATVRVSVFFSDGKQLAQGGPVASQTYSLAPNEFRQLSGLVKSIVGDSRETMYGDLHNVQVRFEIISGTGAVVPFVTSTDNGTGDTVLRTE
ncbi:MAG TPA: hypothetical protein VHL58_04610 [Thermoanaerobaculia bacterium]|nr:hypothetical protein [Thermoanaerobaculia bacterium]